MGDYYGTTSHYNKVQNNNPNHNNSGGGGGGGGGQQKGAIDADKIFVGGLSWQTTEESLRYHFEQYGAVSSVEVMRDRVTGDPRGFAFVVFNDEETVNLVMADKDNHEINHKMVDVKRAQARGVAPPSIHHGGGGGGGGGRPPFHQQQQHQQQDDQSISSHQSRAGGPPGQQPQQQQQQQPQRGGGGGEGGAVENNKIFVGGLPPSVDNDGLKQIFEQFGPVSDAIVMIDQIQRRSRGFGFVTFENGSNGAQNALQAQPIPVHDRRVEVKLATPKGDQQRGPRGAGGPGGFHGGGGGPGGFHGGVGASGTGPSGQPMRGRDLGLRAGISGSSSGVYAGLAAAYGRSGWKAGYGSRSFGAAGWNVWNTGDGAKPIDKSGFSFDMLEKQRQESSTDALPPSKRARIQ